MVNDIFEVGGYVYIALDESVLRGLVTVNSVNPRLESREIGNHGGYNL